jgi:hypothetical protein
MEEENKKTVSEWYFRPWVILVAILGFGPLGLFLLWFRPETKVYLKVSISVVVIGLTIWMSIETARYYQLMVAHYEELAETMANM